MKTMKTAVLAAAMAGLCAGAAVAQGLPQKYKDSGKVVVAHHPIYPPVDYKDADTSELKGIAIDLAKALAKELDVKIEWSDIVFAQMIPALVTGRADLVHTGMSDLESRRDSAQFLDYMRSGAQIYTSSGKADVFKTLEDLCGKTVGASRTTSFPAEVSAWSAQNCEAKGKPAIKISGAESSADARVQLKQGRIDAVAQGFETIPYMMQLEKGAYVLIGQPVSSYYQGIVFAKTGTELMQAYAGAFKAILNNGVYKQIMTSYGLESMMLDGVYINSKRVD
jgi:polar amino acid transport system substrate-binding protein